MNILITGGSGFIGRHLCDALLKKGHSLTILTRNSQRTKKTLGSEVELITSLDELDNENQPDVIINLAGEPIIGRRWSDRQKHKIRDSRILFTRKLVERVRGWKTKPGLFISGSAIGFYGDTGETELDELSPAADDFGARLCKDWEHEANQVKALGIRTCILRTGLVLGADGGMLARMLLPFRLGLGGRIGSGRQYMSWIHIDDYIAIVLQMIEHKEMEGVYNMTAPVPVTNQEFTKTLARALHRPAFFNTPAWLLKLLLGEMSGLLLGGQKVLPRGLLQSGYLFQFPDLESALQQIIQQGRKP